MVRRSCSNRCFFRHAVLMTALILSVLTPGAFAQVTTGNIAGTVTIAGDGAVLPGVTIDAVHVPTGTRYTGVTNATGRYLIPNARVGGPYEVSASLDGFENKTVSDVEVRLGTTVEAPLELKVASVAEVITVTADAELINPARTGSTSRVSTEQIETLPTVNRSLQDFARTNPYFGVDAQDASSTRIYVAGRNNRYNTIQIDGAVNNDLFGLADTGTPGGQTDTQPISLDAIEELQLVVSPYDVRQGGFTGGGINAVTRSGTNRFEGSIFGSTRNEDLVGDGPLNTPIANFDQDQYGGRIGGPIMQDRLFFFLSGEVNDKQSPTGISADGSTGTQFNDPASLTRVRNFLMNNYGYDPGSLGDIPGETTSDLLFGRLDFNVNDSNQLTLRHNYVDSGKDVISDRSTSRFRFDSAIYSIVDETNSTVAQLNSVISDSLFNEARIGIQTIRDARSTPVIFPTVEIGGTGPRSGAIHVGTERFSGANSLDQDVLEITDDLTWIVGAHNVTVGTHNEFFEFKNLFLSEAYGYYYFPTIDAFEAGTPQEYRVSFATGNDPRRPTSFEAGQYGVYVNDQWRVSGDFSLTLGLRVDVPTFPDSPSFNPTVQQLIGYDTSNTASEDPVLSPRVGFNWNPFGSADQQLRGGIGIFAGRTPYVWISNVYGNTGIESVALSCTGSCQRPLFNPDPFNQPTNLGAGGSLTVDLIDPDFEFPRVMRATLGYDAVLPWDIRGTAEVLFSQTQKDVFYYNVNREPTGGTSSLDGRPTFRRVNNGVADALLLTNTDEGQETTATLQVSKPIGNLTLAANYAWQDTDSALDATSSRAISNWQFRHSPGDIFFEDTSRSAFEIENRFNIAATYTFDTGMFGHVIGLFYNAQSGRPYSLMMGGDPNTDGYSTNDLLFVPGGANSFFLCPASARTPAAGSPCGSSGGSTIAPLDSAQFVTFLQNAGAGAEAGILSRYGMTEPWTRQLDFHYELGIPVMGIGTNLTFDILNLLNMFDEDQGVVEFVGNQNYTPVVWIGNDPDTGKPVYRENFNGSTVSGAQFTTADTRSRWQARVGLRFLF